MKGKFYESEYEEALIDLLQQQGWQYTGGTQMQRNNREVLLTDDMREYLLCRYPDLTQEDIDEIINHLRHTSGQTHFDLLRNTFYLIRDGYRYTRHGDGKVFDIEYVDLTARLKIYSVRLINSRWAME